jgi:hypothetical protein
MIDATTPSESTAPICRRRWLPGPPGMAERAVAGRLRLETAVRTGTMTGGLIGVASAIVTLDPVVALIIVAGLIGCYGLWLVACFVLAVKRPRHCITMSFLRMDIRPAPNDQRTAVQPVSAPHDGTDAPITTPNSGRSP